MFSPEGTWTLLTALAYLPDRAIVLLPKSSAQHTTYPAISVAAYRKEYPYPCRHWETIRWRHRVLGDHAPTDFPNLSTSFSTHYNGLYGYPATELQGA